MTSFYREIIMKYFIKKTINAIIYLLSLCVPRTSSIILVGGWFGQRFADNSKALYLYLSQHKDQLKIKKVIFITKDKKLLKILKNNNFCVLYANSFLSIWYHLRSKIHIVDEGGIDLNRFFSTRAMRFNLWHGFPLKKIGFYCIPNIKNIEEAIIIQHKKENYQIGLWHNAYYLAFSKILANHLQFAFGCSHDHIIYGIYPRHAYIGNLITKFYLPDELNALNLIKKAKQDNKIVILYLPTFRDNESQNITCWQTITLLISYLKQNNLFLVTKLHFAAKIHTSESIHDIHNDAILNLTKESDVYNFLELSDILVTDYSSIYFDYILFHKPIIFYCFDYDYYKNSDRGFLYNYRDVTPGDKVKNLDELKKSILYIKNHRESYLAKYNHQVEHLKRKIYGASYNFISNESMLALYNSIITRSNQI